MSAPLIVQVLSFDVSRLVSIHPARRVLLRAQRVTRSAIRRVGIGRSDIDALQHCWR
jgi:hypothetical protein